MSEFYDKYLKYKNKYLNLKTELAQEGGLKSKKPPHTRPVLILYNSTTNFGKKMDELKKDFNGEKTILDTDLFIDPNIFQYNIGSNEIKSLLYFGFKNITKKDEINNKLKIKKIKPLFRITDKEKMFEVTGGKPDNDIYREIMRITNSKFNEIRTKLVTDLNSLINDSILGLTVEDWINNKNPGNLRSEIEKSGLTVTCNNVDTNQLFKGIDSLVLISNLKKEKGLHFLIQNDLSDLKLSSETIPL
jgi:hypothetical protein